MSGQKIMVVDDEARMRKLVSDFLTKEGYEVVEAADGEAAMDHFYEEKDIALVILDVMMPRMDGWQVLREIRESSQVPVIMLTARSDERDELKGFDLGVDEYVTKPFSPRTLVARVEAILRRTGANGDNNKIELSGIVLGTLMYLDNRALIRNEESEDKITQQQARAMSGEDAPAEDDNAKTEGTESVQETDEEFYDKLLPADKTVDIAGLKESVNPDIYAWLYIPDTGIDDAILQHPEDVLFYSDHNSKGEADENGAFFTQFFNSKDFSDNVTVVYGHNGGNDKGFSRLNLYADPDFFKAHPYIYVYTGNAILLYETFAAYESDDKLIVMFYGTDDRDMYNAYIQRLEEIAGISSNLNKEYWPTYEDKILTLSTGVSGKDDRRFIVQARFAGGFVKDDTDE